MRVLERMENTSSVGTYLIRYVNDTTANPFSFFPTHLNPIKTNKTLSMDVNDMCLSV